MKKNKKAAAPRFIKIPVRLPDAFTASCPDTSPPFIKCNLKDYPTYFCNVSITAPGFLVISVKYWQVSSASPAS